MVEKKFQSVLWVSLALLSASACGNQSTAAETVADARAAALTNQVDDDKDGHVDENDEGLDEDEDGRVDEGGEHRDACERREARGRSPSMDSGDADAGVEQDADKDEADVHHDEGADSDMDADEAKSHGDKQAAEIAAIDCSDVSSASDDASGTDSSHDDATPPAAGM